MQTDPAFLLPPRGDLRAARHSALQPSCIGRPAATRWSRIGARGNVTASGAADRRRLAFLLDRIDQAGACLLIVLSVLQVTTELPLRLALSALLWLTN